MGCEGYGIGVVAGKRQQLFRRLWRLVRRPMAFYRDMARRDKEPIVCPLAIQEGIENNCHAEMRDAWRKLWPSLPYLEVECHGYTCRTVSAVVG